MNDEPAPTGLAAALAAFQAELPRVGKDETAKVTSQRTGKTHTYTYATLGTVSQVIVPLLGRHGLSFIAKPTMHPEHGFVLSYALMHTSGEAERGLYPLPGSGSPQEIGSAITYARRYCLCAVAGVAPDDDDDDAASAEQGHRQRADGLPTNADGSLSRSRTTDAEKDAAGVMTGAQQAEHTALGGGHPNERKTPAAERSNVTRLGQRQAPTAGGPMGQLGGTGEGPVAQRAPTGPNCTLAEPCHLPGCPACYPDPWQDQPPGLLPQGDPEDRPGSIGPKQSRTLHAKFTELGIKDRANRLGLVAEIIGREVASSNELSYTEAGKVLEALNARTKTEARG